MKKELVDAKMILKTRLDEIEVDIEGYVHYTVDEFYGEDANGGRAESRTFVDDVTDITAYDFEGEEVLLSKEEDDEAVNILSQKFLMG